MATSAGYYQIDVTLNTEEAKKKAKELSDLKREYHMVGEIPVLSKGARYDASRNLLEDLLQGGMGLEAYIKTLASQVQTDEMKKWLKGKMGKKWGGTDDEKGLAERALDEVVFYSKIAEAVLPLLIHALPKPLEDALKAVGVDVNKISQWVTTLMKTAQNVGPAAGKTVDIVKAGWRLGDQINNQAADDIFKQVLGYQVIQDTVARKIQQQRQQQWITMMKNMMSGKTPSGR